MRSDPALCFLEYCGPAPGGKSKRSGESSTANTSVAGDDDEDKDVDIEDGEAGSDVDDDIDLGDDSSTMEKKAASSDAAQAAVENGFLPWPVPMDINTRLRRLVATFQRQQRKQEQQLAQKINVSIAQ